MECCCVARNKPIRWGKTILQTATVTSLWFWDLLVYPELFCDWPVHNQDSWNFSGVHGVLSLTVKRLQIKLFRVFTSMKALFNQESFLDKFFRARKNAQCVNTALLGIIIFYGVVEDEGWCDLRGIPVIYSDPSWLLYIRYPFYRVRGKFSHPLLFQTSTMLNLVVQNPNILVQKCLVETQYSKIIGHFMIFSWFT